LPRASPITITGRPTRRAFSSLGTDSSPASGRRMSITTQPGISTGATSRKACALENTLVW
jgi:hypothetical protein